MFFLFLFFWGERGEKIILQDKFSNILQRKITLSEMKMA